MSINPWNDQYRLDRLVDGELSRAQYRETLRDLDKHPELWKQCAMRFLEQQALRGDIAALCVRDDNSAGPQPKDHGKSSHIWPWALAAAASFVIAFAMGTSLGNLDFWDTSADVAIGEVDRIPSGEAAAVKIAEQTTGPNADSPPEATAASRQAETPLEQLTVFVHSDDPRTTHVVDVPVRQWDAEFSDPLSGIPADVLQSMHRLGEVRIESQLMPVQTGDGRHILLPIDRLEITPVNRTYH